MKTHMRILIAGCATAFLIAGAVTVFGQQINLPCSSNSDCGQGLECAGWSTTNRTCQSKGTNIRMFNGNTTESISVEKTLPCGPQTKEACEAVGRIWDDGCGILANAKCLPVDSGTTKPTSNKIPSSIVGVYFGCSNTQPGSTVPAKCECQSIIKNPTACFSYFKDGLTLEDRCKDISDCHINN